MRGATSLFLVLALAPLSAQAQTVGGRGTAWFGPLRGLFGGAPAQPGLPEVPEFSEGKFEIPVYDRTTLPAWVRTQVQETREKIIGGIEDPAIIRFSIPKSQTYLEGVVARLLAGSGLAQDLYVHLNDSSWGRPSAGQSAGVLTMDPELIAIMPSEDEIAAVAAHEIAHHIRAHSEQLAATVKRNPRTGGGDMFSAPQLSRKEITARLAHEREADAMSLLLLANAGYDPYAAIDAIVAIQNEINTEPRYEFDRGREDPLHPTPAQRIAEMERLIRHWGLRRVERTAEGLDEIYRELAGRNRGPGEATAAELYQHYSARER